MIDIVPPVRVLIIGGGIVGLSIAANLAQRGLEDVFLVEKNREFGREETAQSASMLMFNTHNSSPVFIQLAAAAMKEYNQLKNSLGIDPEIQRCGSILVSTTPGGAESMREQVRIQNEKGIASELLTAEEIRRRVSLLKGADIKAGIYSPVDGYINQMTLVNKLCDYSRTHGVSLWNDATVTGIDRDPESIINVQTNSRGLIPADRIIIAAGAQSPELSALFSRRLPLTYSKRVLYEGITDIHLTTPIIEFVDGLDEGYYLRPAENVRCIIGVGPTRDSDQYPTDRTTSFFREETEDFLKRRFPELNVRDLTGIVGIRSMTADNLAYLGPIDSEGRIVAAYGLSGYGITFSPVLAKYLADYIVEGRIIKEMEVFLPTLERFNPSIGIETEL